MCRSRRTGLFVYHDAMIRAFNRYVLPWMCMTLFALSVSAAAADNPATGGRVPTVTRLVKLFNEREAALASAIRAGDASAVERLLTDDFEMRTGATPANPVPRAEWLTEMMRVRDPGDEATGMAVHEVNGAAIVSFVQGGGGPTAIFVVDVWRAAGNDWKLAIRYAAPAGNPTFAIPGGAAAPAVIPKKY